MTLKHIKQAAFLEDGLPSRVREEEHFTDGAINLSLKEMAMYRVFGRLFKKTKTNLIRNEDSETITEVEVGSGGSLERR